VLDRDLAAEVLRTARARGGGFAELYVEERLGISVSLDDGKVEEVTTGLDRGAGVRVGHGTSFGYAYSNRLDRDALLHAAEAAAASVSVGGPGSVVDLRTLEAPVTHPRSSTPPRSRPNARSGGYARPTRRLAPWGPRSGR
jgi:TldD protein